MTFNAILLCIALACAIGFESTAIAAESVQVRAKGEGELPAYARREWVVELPEKYNNPYDPTEIAVDATFTSPDGKKLVLPAFWWEPADADEDKTPGAFTIRFAAPTPGKWQMDVAVVDRSGTRKSETISFDVVPSQSKGFVRRVPDNPNYLQFDNGEGYFMVGLNLGWPEDGMGREKAFDRWFGKLAENGANFARVWMCYPKFMVETRKTGLNRYHQKNLAYYDAIMEYGEKHGIGIMLTFNNYRDLIDRDMWGEAIWPISPYNTANGGPAAKPSEFFTNATAREMYKRRLRYLVGRYAAFTSLVSWEYWNELENSGVLEGSDEWTAEMSKFLRGTDPYKHLISTSGDVPPAHLELEEMDITQRHLYGDDGTIVDFIPSLMQMSLANDRYKKPRTVMEFGISFKGDAKFDEAGKGTALHDSLWAVTMTGSAGTAQHWWWDSYVEKKKLWDHYKGIAKFTKAIDWPKRKFQPLFLDAPTKSGQSAGERLSDLVVKSSGAWCRSTAIPTQILPNGHAAPAVPKFIFGPDKQNWRTPTLFKVDMPKSGKMIIRVGEVSDCALLRVFVDDAPVADFPFSCLPGSPGVKDTKEGAKGYFRATFDKDLSIPLEAGVHKIEFRNLAGDWMAIDSLTFTGTKSSKYSDVQTVAMQDPESGETLVWLHDPQSNWKNDKDGIAPKPIDNVVIKVPVTKQGKYKLDWWDTRSGEITASSEMSSDGPGLKIDVPTFTRDVALRITVVN